MPARPRGTDGSASPPRRLTETAFAHHVARWETDRETDPEALDVAMRYAAWATLTPEGQAHHRGGTLFHVPQRIDPQHLVPVETIERDGVTMTFHSEHRPPLSGLTKSLS